MKLVYTSWKDVKKFLACVDEPVSDVFSINIRKKWLTQYAWQRYVYEVEIPKESINTIVADSRSE